MCRRIWIACLFFLVVAQTSFAADSAAMQGTWKVVAMETEVQATGEKMYPMGKNPTGYVIFSDSRVSFVLAAEVRKPGNTTEEKASLLDSLVAYTGKYRLEGDKWITSVEVAWNPAWVGTEQTRSFQVAADRLQEMTAWAARPDKRMARAIITYERAK